MDNLENSDTNHSVNDNSDFETLIKSKDNSYSNEDTNIRFRVRSNYDWILF